MHLLLFYELAPDYLERRPLHSAEHLALAWQAVERGELLLGGAVGDPVDLSLLVFAGEGPGVAERFAAADPYVRHGIVRSYRVRPWTTVVGPLAATPVRP